MAAITRECLLLIFTSQPVQVPFIVQLGGIMVDVDQFCLKIYDGVYYSDRVRCTSEAFTRRLCRRFEKIQIEEFHVDNGV